MALDMLVMDENNQLLLHASIGEGPHDILMRILEKFGGYRLLLRMRDYYAGSRYSVQEVSQLLEEIERVQHKLESDPDSEALVWEINDEVRRDMHDRPRYSFEVIPTVLPYIDGPSVLSLLRRLRAVVLYARDENRPVVLAAD